MSSMFFPILRISLSHFLIMDHKEIGGIIFLGSLVRLKEPVMTDSPSMIMTELKGTVLFINRLCQLKRTVAFTLFNTSGNFDPTNFYLPKFKLLEVAISFILSICFLMGKFGGPGGMLPQSICTSI